MLTGTLACDEPQTLAILVYLFGSLFSNSFVNLFIVCVLLLAFDFWTVKNVTGRLMVGLRWSSVVNEDGSTSWKFEAREVRDSALNAHLHVCVRACVRVCVGCECLLHAPHAAWPR